MARGRGMVFPRSANRFSCDGTTRCMCMRRYCENRFLLPAWSVLVVVTGCHEWLTTLSLSQRFLHVRQYERVLRECKYYIYRYIPRSSNHFLVCLHFLHERRAIPSDKNYTKEGFPNSNAGTIRPRPKKTNHTQPDLVRALDWINSTRLNSRDLFST